MQKGFLGMFFFCFLVVCFLLPVFLCLCFVKKAQKGYFPAILEVFYLFCSPKRPVLKCFSSFSVFFPAFPFFSPFKIPFFLCFSSINPLLEKILCGGFFCHSILSFPFLMFASLFETICQHPLSEPQVAFVFGIFSVVFVFFSWCMFLPFCFDVGFVLLCFYFVLILFLFGFLFGFLFLLSDYAKHCFPCNSSVCVVLALK